MITTSEARGTPVVIMATLTYFGLPEAWIALVLGVDHLLDMGRSATNVIGNSLATAFVARWEGQLGTEKPGEADDAFIDEPAAAQA